MLTADFLETVFAIRLLINRQSPNVFVFRFFDLFVEVSNFFAIVVATAQDQGASGVVQASGKIFISGYRQIYWLNIVHHLHIVDLRPANSNM